jgi:hypothetical protein
MIRRKGLFFDFGPLGPDPRPRTYDLPAVLGELYARLLFQERYRISDDEWARLFGFGWFPFAGLGNETLGLMLTHVRNGWDMEELTPRIAEEVRSKAASFLQAWLLHPALATYALFMERAISHFQSGDHVRCAELVYPQIEVILRCSPLGSHAGRPGSLLMPHRFEDYLKEVYLPKFNPAAPPEGPAAVSGPQQKASSIAILVVHQLFHSFDPPPRERASAITMRSADPVRQRPPIDAAGAANRWSQWTARGHDEVLARLIERLDASLPNGWKRLQGESLEPFRASVRPGSAWYTSDSTPEHVGVTLSVERTRLRELRGGRVWFTGLPFRGRRRCA